MRVYQSIVDGVALKIILPKSSFDDLKHEKIALTIFFAISCVAFLYFFFFVNFELDFSVTASCIVLKLQFILVLFITKSKKEKYGALEERRIFQIKKGPCLHLLWF
jgi:amino acid transporter